MIDQDIIFEMPEEDCDVYIETKPSAADYQKMLSIWDTASFHKATESLSSSLLKISDALQPIIASRASMETALSSFAHVTSQVAEAAKPLLTNCSSGAFAAVKTLQQSLNTPCFLSEAAEKSAITALQQTKVAAKLELFNAAANNLSSVGESLRLAFVETESIAEAAKACIGNVPTTIGPLLEEAFPPAVSACSTFDFTAFAGSIFDSLKESELISDIFRSKVELPFVPALSDYFSPAVSVAESVKTAISSLALDFNGISDALHHAYDYVDALSGIALAVHSATEQMADQLAVHTLGYHSNTTLHELHHLIISILRRFREVAQKHRQEVGTPIPASIAAVVKVPTTEPTPFVEFADRIRQTYLQKHQRISDESDDLNIGYQILAA